MTEYTILELQKKMQLGKLTSRKIVESFLERIKNIDFDGPCLNSKIEINPDALTITDELDAE